MNWSGIPWWGQIILFVVVVLAVVFLFDHIAQPLIHDLTK